MKVSTKVDGQWKDVYAPYAKVDGEWHTGNLYTKVGGTWICTYKHLIDPTDIAGFKMSYTRSHTTRHPNHPHLIDNPDIPVNVDLTGANIGKLDDTSKGIVFEYTNDEPDTEGICVYEGHLYAMTKDDQLLDVTSPGITMMDPVRGQIYGSDRIQHLNIQIEARVTCECFGYYTAGWNMLFCQTNVIYDGTLHSDTGPRISEYGMRSYPLLPPEQREDTFTGVTMIGIARDMETSVTNMVGNHGKLSQSIYGISINGTSFPFVIELQK